MTQKDVWYQEGLCFECHRCGHCCTFPGGYVWMDYEEIKTMAQALGLGLDAFGKKYLRKVGDKYSLIEKPNGECVMYHAGGCSVYKARPKQCQTFPFWPENLKDPESWAHVKETCQGIDKGAKYSYADIEQKLL